MTLIVLVLLSIVRSVVFFPLFSDLSSVSFTFYLRVPVIVRFLPVFPRHQGISTVKDYGGLR